MPVTIKDVAKAANVSISTVSRVTNNAPNVSPQVRKRVLRVIAKLGYTPSIIAKSLAVRSLRNVAVLMGRTTHEAFANPDFLRILDGIASSLNVHGFNLMLCTHAKPQEEMEHCMNLVCTGSVQGVVVVGAFVSDSMLERLVETHAPFALIGFPSGRPDIHTTPYNTVGTNDKADCYDAVRYLIDLGHKRTGLMHAPLCFAVNQMRYQGYLEALTDHGLRADPRIIGESGYSVEDSFAVAMRLLSENPKPTALFCTDDYKAASALRAAAQLGLTVPRDVSIMGHNDYDICTMTSPTLTTVHLPLYHLGSTAADLVVKAIDSPNEPIKNIQLPTRIVQRDSVSFPPSEASV